MAGYGLKVKTNAGTWVWLTEKYTTTRREYAMKFDSQEGATQYASILSKQNGNVTILVEKL